jgi:glucan phosphoethanolaminetransferase (alkaline phosphatase superfamily)
MSMLNKYQINKLIAIILASLIILIPNISYIYNDFSLTLFGQFLALTNLTFLLFYIFSFNNLSFKIFFFILSSLTFLFVYIDKILHVPVDFGLVLSIFNTNPSEAKEQIQFSAIVVIILHLLFMISVFMLKLKPIKKMTHIKIIGILFISFLFSSTLNLFFNNPYAGKHHKIKARINNSILGTNLNFYPTNYIYNIGKAVAILKGTFQVNDVNKLYNFKLENKSIPYNIVIIIGESARGDHFGLDGYKRNTTPNLAKINNLVFFNNFQSCYTFTFISVSCMMSLHSGETFRSNLEFYTKNQIESSLDAFDYLGFETYLFVVNSYKASDSMFQYFRTIKNIKLIPHALNSLDEKLLPELQNALQQPSNKPKLIILHTMGSHFKYSLRYNEEFKKYNPICQQNEVSNCPTNEVINDYDNTILYTDFILSSAIKMLNNTKNPSLLLYTSDHGESLGENFNNKKIFLHGRPYKFKNLAPQEYDVPSIIWFSDSWLKNFGNKQLNNAKLKKYKNMDHDYISHSILSCSFISSSKIDKKLSLCD